MKGLVIKILISTIAFVLLFFAANTFLCSDPGLAPEIIGVKNSEIVTFNEDEITLTMTVTARNKNNFDIDIEKMFVNIVIGSDTIGSAERTEKLTIGSKATADIVFSSTLTTNKILKLLSEGIDTLNLRLIGTASADLGIITMPVDIDIEFEVAVKEQLAKTIESDTNNEKLIKVESAALKNLSLGESVVEVQFVISNPYGIEFKVKDYPSTIYINNREAGDGNISEVIEVKKSGSESTGRVKYTLSNTQTLSSLFGSVFSRKLEYETDGTMVINILGYEIQFPFRMRGVLIKI